MDYISLIQTDRLLQPAQQLIIIQRWLSLHRQLYIYSYCRWIYLENTYEVFGLAWYQNNGDPSWPGKVNSMVEDLKDLNLVTSLIAGEMLYSGMCSDIMS